MNPITSSQAPAKASAQTSTGSLASLSATAQSLAISMPSVALTAISSVSTQTESGQVESSQAGVPSLPPSSSLSGAPQGVTQGQEMGLSLISSLKSTAHSSELGSQSGAPSSFPSFAFTSALSGSSTVSASMSLPASSFAVESSEGSSHARPFDYKPLEAQKKMSPMSSDHEVISGNLVIDKDTQVGIVNITGYGAVIPSAGFERCHFLEEEVAGTFSGDLVMHYGSMKGHGPMPDPMRFSEKVKDMVGTTLTINFRAKEGSASWDIPFHIIEFPSGARDLVTLMDLEEEPDDEKATGHPKESEDVRKIKKAGGRIISTTIIRQEFILKDYVLTIVKAGVKIGSINLLELDQGFR